MKYVLNNQEMQNVDKETIEQIGVPGLVLMERASEKIAGRLMKAAGKQDRILAVAGCGNNGGDALAAARILLEEGFSVDYTVTGNLEKASGDLKTQLGILNRLGYEMKKDADFNDYDWILEGLFGVGLSREISGVYRTAVENINGSRAKVLSVDIPSGISGDTGKVLGCAVKADATVTFGGPKAGHLLYPGRSYSGRLYTERIGFFDQTLKKYAGGFSYDREDLLKLPKRKADSHKGTYGKVLIAAGNESMSGAAYFSAKSALRMGSGLVKVISHASNRPILQSMLPEVLFGTEEDLEDSLAWCDCILFGPGMGVSGRTKRLLETVLSHGTKPLVLDADGLNTVSRYEMQLNYQKGCILTPHLLEAARLLHISAEQVKEDLLGAGHRAADQFQSVVVLKDAATLAVSGDDPVYYNRSGNHGMATGGSGDVLSGIIASLLGRGMEPFEAAALGVYVHGLAGDHAAERLGHDSMLASDIIDSVSSVLGGIKNESVL
ncbi:NAD(P)H-hydrate dehydratase [Anaerostipes sp.]|uniref:NAD(P)H-hydrate dehydratase n=1 Tax=Anaerostipes sp. TaxID=1872530 RepID=UPI0025C2CF8E|nr:NAD(P)H-hydrate dehydratase [Anaerostipes sp.]MBS7009318.1 NAD(P)H-hydrate dehydratase [Anaerostipes sp.]